MGRLTGVIGLAVAIFVWACLPFSRTWVTSPPIVGVYRAETGEPLSGVLLAKSLESTDSLCTSPTVQTTTDSVGAFSLPLTEYHQAVIFVAPFEHVYGYSFCARVAGTMRFVFEEVAPVQSSFSRTPLSLTCIESRTPNTKPVVCTKDP